MGSVDDLKNLVQGYVNDVFNRHDPNALDRYFDKNAHDGTLPPDVTPGLDGMKKFYTELFKAFPDCRLTVNHLLAEGDKVAFSWTFTGTHEYEFLGIPASRNEVEIDGCEIDLVKNGKIVEVFGTVDMLTMFQQIADLEIPGRLAKV